MIQIHDMEEDLKSGKSFQSQKSRFRQEEDLKSGKSFQSQKSRFRQEEDLKSGKSFQSQNSRFEGGGFEIREILPIPKIKVQTGGGFKIR